MTNPFTSAERATARRRGGLRWWFENRQTGRITIAQWPNWPLYAIAVGWVVLAVVDEGSTLHDVAHWAVFGLWVFWAGDEVVRGVNPWRRVLGAAVLAWQVLGLVR